MSAKPSASVLSTSFVITGNLLGGGILAMPILLGLAGFWPAVFGVVCVWAMMTATAMILAAQPALTQSETSDLPTFFQHELGTAGKWITVVANAVVLYGALTAYLGGATAVIVSLAGVKSMTWIITLVFFCAATMMTLFGMRVMAKGNVVIMVVLWSAFLLITVICGEHMEPRRLALTDWVFLPMALPVVVTGFHFHNIIPTVCRNLNNNQTNIRLAMLIGTSIGLVMNLLWLLVVMGAMPLEGDHGMMASYQQNLPATVPLKSLMTSPVFTIASSLFALLALSAAYMANGLALTNFVRDLCATYLKKPNRYLAAAIAFIPPLAIVFVNPNIFLEAVNVIGGVGIDLIFGILPGVLVIKYASARWKWTGWLLVVLFGFIFVFELGQEFGLLHIKPHIEHFTHHMKH
jgi:tyrosine-specific transport protein